MHHFLKISRALEKKKKKKKEERSFSKALKAKRRRRRRRRRRTIIKVRSKYSSINNRCYITNFSTSGTAGRCTEYTRRVLRTSSRVPDALWGEQREVSEKRARDGGITSYRCTGNTPFLASRCRQTTRRLELSPRSRRRSRSPRQMPPRHLPRRQPFSPSTP